MKAFLLYPDRDFDPSAATPHQEDDLVRDLGLDTLFDAMAGQDAGVRDVVRRVVLHPLTDPEVIGYRQRILRDCLAHPDVLREMYRIAVDSIAREQRIWPSLIRSPEYTMVRAVQVMELFTGQLRALRAICDAHPADWTSAGFTRLLGMLRTELDDAWFRTVEEHLRRLRFKNGVLVSAGLGPGCKGAGYVLRRPPAEPGWRARLARGGAPSYTYRVPDRDEAAARDLAQLRDRGVDLAADALARSADHVLGFFVRLRDELAFYLGCLNAHERLAAKGEPLCFPATPPRGRCVLECRGLYDVCLSLRTDERVVGNDVAADGVPLIVVTGANEGGKSTFLRSVGLAQLMAQSGMFVGAGSFAADLREALFTHFRREEDAGMESGKLDEELLRMNAIADRLTPGGIVLFNESFAATNEREGSELARQILRALLESGVKAVVVTHLFDLADGLRERYGPDAVFLRAERRPDGTRTFKLAAGAPLPTGFGEDLFRRVFT